MKKYFKFAGILLLAIYTLSSCKKSEAPYEKLSSSKENAVVAITRFNGNTQNLIIFPYQDEARKLEFSASFGALGLPSNPINVQFAVDNSALDSLNDVRSKQGMSTYQIFPSDSYTISSLQATIPSGKVSSSLISVSYFSRKFVSTVDYVLPISIVSADGYKISASKTIFLVANRLSETLATKTGWTATASSEELTGEGSSNGRAAQLIDGNIATYWHSKYLNGELPFPHSVTIDMKSEIYVTRVDLGARQNATNGFRKFNLEGSKDGSTWTSLGNDLVMDPAIKAFQPYPVIAGYQRYLRITMTEGYMVTTKSTNLAEINVYGY